MAAGLRPRYGEEARQGHGAWHTAPRDLARRPCLLDHPRAVRIQLARVHQSVRVQRPLDLFHERDGPLPELGLEILDLAEADRVLARACPVELLRTENHVVLGEAEE